MAATKDGEASATTGELLREASRLLWSVGGISAADYIQKCHQLSERIDEALSAASESWLIPAGLVCGYCLGRDHADGCPSPFKNVAPQASLPATGEKMAGSPAPASAASFVQSESAAMVREFHDGRTKMIEAQSAPSAGERTTYPDIVPVPREMLNAAACAINRDRWACAQAEDADGEEAMKELHDKISMLLLARTSARSSGAAIGEVIGHKGLGQALVEWYDCGLRPLGMKLYAAPAARRTYEQWLDGFMPMWRESQDRDPERFRQLKCAFDAGELSACSATERTEGDRLDHDFELTEAMHTLGAQEGETVLQLAYRVKEKMESLNRIIVSLTPNA